jgi:hypothetical protein
MKTFFAILGVIFLIIVVVGGIAFGTIAMRENPMDVFSFWFLSVHGGKLNQESKAYADAAIPAIFASWNEKELLDRESPELKQSLTQQQLDEIFQRCSSLGHLQKSDPAQGQSMMSAMTHTIKAQYTAKATFDKGEAVIDLTLIKHENQWQIAGFFVKSPALQQQQQPQQQPH